MKENSLAERCPSNKVVRGAQLIAREFAGALVSAGQDPSLAMPFVRRGIQTVDEASEIVISNRCVKQVLSVVLPADAYISVGQEDLLRK